MGPRNRATRPAMYNTPSLRMGGFGALQVEAIENRPLSIARRHLAASQLRMREVEPDELSSGEWVRFLVMEEQERERWITLFRHRRRNSDESASSVELDRETAYLKMQEARQEAEDARREARRATIGEGSSFAAAAANGFPPPENIPAASLWAREFEENTETGQGPWSRRRPMHARRAVTDSIVEAPPAYDTVVRPSTPPPAYEPRSDDGPGS